MKNINRFRFSSVILALAVLACNLPSTAVPNAKPDAASPAPSEDVAPTAPVIWEQPDHAIGVRGGEFFDVRSGEKFVPRGANYVFVPISEGRYSLWTLKVGVYDGARTRADFARLSALGYNTVRVFLDHCGKGPGCIAESPAGGLNPAYLDNIADMMQAGHENGIYILFTSNDLPDDGGYSQEANSRAGDTFAGYRNSFYLTPEAISATRRYWRDILTGLVERRAAFDAVLAWELLNEQWMFEDQPPLYLTSGMVETTTGTYDLSDPEQKRRMVSEGLIYYIAQMREEILTHDPTGLVTIGYFPPHAAPGWYVDTAPLLVGADVDFFDFHAYLGPGGTVAGVAQDYGMVGYESKPIVMGEYGAFRHMYSEVTSGARAVSEWVAASCPAGFDGWLYWTYYPANPEIDDRTWGLTDEDGYLMNLFAPVNQPDPCMAVDVPGGNIAYGKPATASNALPDQPPAFAVDENEASQWGAGTDAPQWIEIDLQGAYTITEIRLLVAQYPEGDTNHQLLVRASGSSSFTLAYQFNGFTRDGDWLVFTPDAPLEHIDAIRVMTVSSVSWVAWREIQAFGEAE